jgi:acyl-CoA synthetase (AMP-forming)/AMP-acid ligase II
MNTVGDVGYVDNSNFLYLTDRATFMIISGGVNIFPQECENLLISHPKVAEAAVNARLPSVRAARGSSIGTCRGQIG